MQKTSPVLLSCFAMLFAAVLVFAGCSGNSAATSESTPPPPAAAATAAAWYVPEESSLTAAQMTSLFDTQQLYFNVQSSANSTGEIRGVITPSSSVFATDNGDPFAPNPANNPVTFGTILGGDQVRPRNVVTRASGYGSATLNPLSKQLSGFIISTGISGNAAHIQDGLPGSSGSIVVTLEGGPVIWTVPANTVLSDPQIARLNAGAFYFNVHSAVFPDGEIRGQLNQQIRCAFLKGSNEVPPVTTSATAIGFLGLTPATRQFSGYVKVGPLSSAIISVGLHIGAAGTNGVGITFLENRGNGIWAIPLNTVLSNAQVTSFNNDELYFNIHTANNIGGELRGQLIRSSIRIGTATLDGSKEVPPVTTSATGVGMLAWNSVTEQISGSVTSGNLNGTAARIHSGAASTNGPTVISLTPSSPVSIAPTAGISFALDIQPIFNSRCSGVACHTAGGIAPMSLEPSVAYVNVSTLVLPGNSAASTLYQRLTGVITPRMPVVGGPLNQTSLDLIKNWIDSGALNN